MRSARGPLHLLFFTICLLTTAFTVDSTNPDAKYRKALLDEKVTAIIQETAVEIANRFTIEMESIGTDMNPIHLRCSAHQKLTPGRIVQIFKNITAREVFWRKPRQASFVGRGVLDGRVSCGNGRRTLELAEGRTVCAAP